MAASFTARVGSRVEVIGKGLVGTVSYVGMTAFATGKWIGVALDEPKGKNDGVVQGKRYFDCPANHGIFVRQTQLSELQMDPAVEQAKTSPSSGIIPPSSGSSKIAGLRQPTSSSQSGGSISPPKSGLKPPGSKTISPPNASGLKKPSPTGIATPKSGLVRPQISSGKSNDDLKSGIQRSASGTPSGMERPSSTPQSGLQKPGSLSLKSTPSLGLQKPGFGLQKPSPATSTSSQSSDVSPLQVKKEESISVKEEPTADEFAQPPPAHRVIAQSEEVSDLQRKLIEKEKAVIDLEEKLNLLKQRRLVDQSKLKEVEKLRMQNQQLIEYKSKWQESQRDLQNQLRQAQSELREAGEKMNLDNDVVELQEAVEMATLDKEMAEEKFESLAQEHDQLKEKLEEVSLELDILKNEISDGGIETVAESAQVKQFEHQNIRLKEALLKLKDIAQNDKQELAQTQKVNKEISQKVSMLGGERDKLQERIQHAECQIDELKEQVDLALGAEEMVEKLTDKNLEQEEQIENLEETIADLEALRELNEELEESHVQTEHDLREELDMADNKIREFERQLTARIEQENDYQETIGKFRELVQNLQGRIKDLHDQSIDESKDDEVDPSPVPEIDFKTRFAEAKQYGRIIELELNKYHVQESNKQMQMINAFLPDHFTKRGGDFDGILLLLLLERLQFKCQLLSNQLHEKHNIQEIVEGGQNIEGLEGDQASYACLLAYHLSKYRAVVSQFLRALQSCDIGTFVRVSGQYPELAVHEKILDNYIALLSKDMLDDTVSIEVLEKTITQYQNLYRLQLATAPRDCTEFLTDSLIMFNCGAESISVDTQRMKGLAKNCDEGSAFVNLISTIELKNMEIKQFCRKIKRRMIQDSSTTLSYPDTVKQEIMDALAELNIVIRYTQDLASVLSLKASTLDKGEYILSGDLDESSQDCVIMIYEKEEEPLQVLSVSFELMLRCLSGIALKLPEGEYDTEPEEKPTIAYLERALAFKEELSSTTKLELKVDQKVHELNEMKKTMKIKADELSEANIRISLLDKRADNAAKEANTKVEQMSKKLETVQGEYRDKAKQNEKTMDALQGDIDALENERVEMKKKLELYSKKSNMDLARMSQSSAAMAGIVAAGKPGSAMASLAKAGVAGANPVQVVLNDSPVFLAQIENQKKALKYLQTQNWALKCAQMKADLAKLPKPYTPKILWRDGKFISNPNVSSTTNSNEAKVNSQTVLKECNSLFKNLQELAVFPKIVDITKGNTADGKYKPSPEEQFVQQKNLLITLEKKKDELSRKVETVISKELPGASVQTNLRNFLSPEYSRLKQENVAPVHIASLRIPPCSSMVKKGVRNISLTPRDFVRIHETLVKT